MGEDPGEHQDLAQAQGGRGREEEAREGGASPVVVVVCAVFFDRSFACFCGVRIFARVLPRVCCASTLPFAKLSRKQRG